MLVFKRALGFNDDSQDAVEFIATLGFTRQSLYDYAKSQSIIKCKSQWIEYDSIEKRGPIDSAYIYIDKGIYLYSSYDFSVEHVLDGLLSGILFKLDVKYNRKLRRKQCQT